MASFLVLFLKTPALWAVTVISGPTLSMDPNGATPLAGVIQLQIDQPARVTVVLNDGVESRTIEFAEFGTDFSLPLLGLKPNNTYTIAITLTDQQNLKTSLTPLLQAVTNPLPDDFPNMDVLVSDPGKMEPGYTMMARFIRGGADPNVTVGTPGAGSGSNSYTIIVDNTGDVVWYSTLGEYTNHQLINGNLLYRINSDVIEIDMLGNEIRRVTMDDPGTGLTHELHPTADGKYLSITMQQATIPNFPTSETDPNAPTATANVEDNPVVEFDQAGNLLNIWPLVDMIDTKRIGYNSLNLRPASLSPLGYDWAHVNAVVDDQSDDSIIISVRHQDAVVKFSRATGDVEWILGPHANWSPEFQPYLLTPVGQVFEWQYHQHAPTITPSGTILLFDNGNFRASPFDGNGKIPASQNYSRAVEFAVDSERMEVRQIWEYGGNIAESLYAGHISDANWLQKTGNVLITFGGISYTGGVRNVDLGLGDVSTRIIEVTHDIPAVKVFDLSLFDPAPGARMQVYRSERIPDLYPLDSDADGIPDYKDNCVLEPNGPLVPGDALTSQLDTDGDSAGNVCDLDDDNDGMTDDYEIANQLAPLDESDADLDWDGDGLTNLEEFQLGSSANNADTDGDGVNDGEEVIRRRNLTVHEGVVMTIINLILND
ncbi:MAG: aryl-sulfate sulfotransferase [Gammaproteobacteria bacterium]|nr:aryl-sulfate sulfotransferase [Gammaproteobacteria bacterium]MDH3468884.1 aryl-sulfate sulfotransferase [Gammaproteobacteria bacterium]